MSVCVVCVGNFVKLVSRIVPCEYNYIHRTVYGIRLYTRYSTVLYCQMVVQNATDTLPRKSYALLHKKICDANADTGADTSEKRN